MDMRDGDLDRLLRKAFRPLVDGIVSSLKSECADLAYVGQVEQRLNCMLENHPVNELGTCVCGKAKKGIGQHL